MQPLANLRNTLWPTDGIRWRILQITLIVLAGAAVYAHTLRVEFVLDDYGTISFHGPKHLLEILLHGGSRRVADFTLAINYRLHGLQVAGYHLVNLTIHLAAAITLYFVILSAITALHTSFSSPERSAEASVLFTHFLPLTAALFFTLHPVQTQAVTYIVQRYTSLATCLYLLSTLCFIRARLAYETDSSSLRPIFLGGLSCTAGILAMGSKQIAFTLPVMLLVLEWCLFRGRLLNRRFYISCGIAVALVLAITLTSWHDRSFQEMLDSLHRATSEDHYTSRVTYFLTQTRVVATYLRLLCLPLGQRLFYDYPTYSTLFSVPVIAALALHFSLLITAVIVMRRSKQQLCSGDLRRGMLQRLAALGIFWFYVTMAVESSIFPITDTIFEHRIYLPSVGFFLTVASGMALTVHVKWIRPKTAWTLTTLICLVLGGLTIARNRMWSDTLVLWQDTVAKAPGKGIAVANLAGEYMKLDQPGKALPLFVRALVLNQVYLTKTKVHLGMTLQQLGVDRTRFTTGEEILSPREHTGAIALDRKEQNRLQCIMYNNLGLAYEYLGEPHNAQEPYRAALLIDPVYDLAWYNLGLLSIRLGDTGQADRALIQLKKFNPALATTLEKALPH